VHLTRLVVFLLISVTVLSLSAGCSLVNQTSSTGTSQVTSATSSTISSTTSVNFPPGIDLTFETLIEPGRVGGPYQGENAQIRVISMIPTPTSEELGWVYPDNQPKILGVDYSKYFLVLVFNGFRGGIFSYLKIQRIWQNDGIVHILAHFNDIIPEATSLPATNSQYQVVQISRNQISQSGTIIFKLLDEIGQERAETSVSNLAVNE
jgi:hypothetical protein